MAGIFSKGTDELGVPLSIRSDKDAMEVLRAWTTKQGLSVTLRSGVWEDPAAYGIMLADLARHIANAFKQTHGKEIATTLQRIREGLNAELDSPTDVPTGEIQKRS